MTTLHIVPRLASNMERHRTHRLQASRTKARPTGVAKVMGMGRKARAIVSTSSPGLIYDRHGIFTDRT